MRILTDGSNRMKKTGAVLIRILAHVTIILSLVVIVLVILSFYNPRMGFMTGDFSRSVISLLAVAAAVGALIQVAVRR